MNIQKIFFTFLFLSIQTKLGIKKSFIRETNLFKKTDRKEETKIRKILKQIKNTKFLKKM